MTCKKPDCGGYGDKVCEPTNDSQCEEGKKFCNGDCWNWCCPEELTCIFTSGGWAGNGIADCGSPSCENQEPKGKYFTCSTGGWKFSGGNKCCLTDFEDCQKNPQGKNYPTCVAKNVNRPGYTRCQGTGEWTWQAIWCPYGKVCTVQPNGAANCVKPA